MKMRAFLHALVIAALLSGCGGEVIIHDSSEVITGIYKEAHTLIKPGITQRSTLQEMLGAPLFFDENLKLEVYRTDEADTIIFWAYFVPIAPAGKSSFNAYFLIAYDDNWIVQDSDYLFISEPSKGQAQLREYGSSGEAVAGWFTFGAYWETTGKFLPKYKNEDFLFAASPIIRESLTLEAHLSNCKVSISSSGEDVKYIFIDGIRMKDSLRRLIHNNTGSFLRLDTSNPLPDRDPDKPYVWRIQLPPGKHTIQTSWMIIDKPENKTFTCAAGEQRFIHIHSSAKGTRKYFTWRGYEIESFDKSITITDHIPDDSTPYDVLLYLNGKYVDMQPWSAGHASQVGKEQH